MTFRHTMHTFAFASIAAIGCQTMLPGSDIGGSPTSGVTIDLDRSSYSAGNRVQLRVTNHTNETVGFNPCTRIIERRQADSWVTVPEPGRVCTMQIYLVSPHGSRTDNTELPAWLPRGTYRLALTLTRETTGGAQPTPPAMIRAVSGQFQVQ